MSHQQLETVLVLIEFH